MSFSTEWQKIYELMPPFVEFHKGITAELVSRESLQGKTTLLAIDDLNELADESLITSIFVRFSHHRYIQ